MATAGSIGRRTSEAIQRIEAQCVKLSGGQTLVLPRKNRHGTEMLLMAQLTTIADFLETVTAPASAYEGLTKKQLLERLEARGISPDKRAPNSKLIEILETAEKAAEEAT